MNRPETPPAFSFTSPAEALEAMLTELKPVGTEVIPLSEASGRVLAQPLVADRDSPPCDVSQMDGYAVRLSDLDQGSLEVAGEALIGQQPPALPSGKAMRIFTGAPIPPGAEAVIRREDVDEVPGRITFGDFEEEPVVGCFVRHRGENLQGGQEVLQAGAPITPAVVSALASFGVAQPQVFRRVRVGVLVTGNELMGIDARPTQWQIRDSNGPALSAMLSACPWLQVRPPIHVVDEPDRQKSSLGDLLEGCDAVLLTGGVSMGRYDHVPAVVTSLGGRTVFHKLPIRPGKPMLAAVGPRGQAVLGLPGNPISVMVTAKRLGAAALRHLAGFRHAASPVPVVTLTRSDDATLPLVWFRPVRLTGPGCAELVANRGSGDMVSAARSDGFVEIPPASYGEGPWPFYRWEL